MWHQRAEYKHAKSEKPQSIADLPLELPLWAGATEQAWASSANIQMQRVPTVVIQEEPPPLKTRKHQFLGIFLFYTSFY